MAMTMPYFFQRLVDDLVFVHGELLRLREHGLEQPAPSTRLTRDAERPDEQGGQDHAGDLILDGNLAHVAGGE